jgi:signal transduction histidine kinase
LGPFAEAFNLADELRFLTAVTNAIGSFTLTELEVLYLEQERKRWESAAWLLTHQLRTALTPITTQVGRAKSMAGKITGDTTARRAAELLGRTETLILRLAEGSKQTLDGLVLQVERSDMEFERYPLSVLVANVAEGFATEAERRRRQLVVEKSVELLPEAEVDVARFTIVLSNMLDNAIKYSYPNTIIKVRAVSDLLQDPRRASAVIEIDDLGDEIRPEDRQRIFEQGTRALTAAKMGRIPGSGLGLWEARAVIEAHGGEIGVTCEPTQVQRSFGAAFRVVFSITIPLRQKEAKGRTP